MRCVFASLFVLLLAACDPMVSPGGPEQHVGDAIHEQEAAMMSAVSAKDAVAVAAFYAPDAQMFSPGVAHTTPGAIRAAFQGMFDDPNGSLMFQSDDLIIPASGEYVVSQGTFVASYTDPVTRLRASQSGNYIIVWRRLDDGSWRIIRDITAPAPENALSP